MIKVTISKKDMDMLYEKIYKMHALVHDSLAVTERILIDSENLMANFYDIKSSWKKKKKKNGRS